MVSFFSVRKDRSIFGVKAIFALGQWCWRQLCKMILVQPSMRSYLEPLIRLWQPDYRAGFYAAQWLGGRQQGQFLQVTLKPERRWPGFRPGQHLTLTIEINGRAVSRCFSVSSSLQQYQQEGSISLCMQIQPDGQLTRFLAAAIDQPPSCYISAAAGDFVLSQHQPVLMLAAGSGITPIYAMLSSISRLTQPITLIYSSRAALPIFAAELQALSRKFPLLQLHRIHSETEGRLTPTQLLQWVPDVASRRAYLCGPTGFSQQWQSWLRQQGVAAQDICQESFGISASAESSSDQPLLIKTGSGQVEALGQGSLLQSLEQAGLTPRYGCRRGICMQCLCHKQQGQVRHLLTGQLSSTGAESIQLCVSEAVTPLLLDLADHLTVERL